MRDLLGVVDNLQRAIESAEQHDNTSGLLEGVHMVASQLTDVLKKFHCIPIEAEGAHFDPHYHEAIGQVPDASVPAGTVAHVVSTGYKLHDRVVRPSQVLVSVAPETDQTQEGDQQESQQEAEPQGDEANGDEKPTNQGDREG